MSCRCGWDGVGEHPCHGMLYACKKPSTERYYEPYKLYSLAGVQNKLSVVQTFACDECWAKFVDSLKKEDAHG